MACFIGTYASARTQLYGKLDLVKGVRNTKTFTRLRTNGRV